MSYLIINEDLKTAAHNIWTRGTGYFSPHMMNMKNFNPLNVTALPAFVLGTIASNLLGSTDRIDNAYFDHHYELSEKLINKLRNWCAKAGGSVVTVGQMRTKNGFQLNEKDALARQNTRKATRGFGKGMITTATAYKKIPVGNKGGCYVIYLTFDAESIEDVKVLKLKAKGMNPEDDNSYTVVKLPQWNSVDPSEYRKED